MILFGIKTGTVHGVAPVSVHGQVNIRLLYELDEFPGKPMQTQLAQESITGGIVPGDRVEIHFAAGIVTAVGKPKGGFASESP